MAKEDLLQCEAVVKETLPDANFKVLLEGGVEIIAYISGNLRQKRIMIAVGDSVTVTMSPYDLTKGRIIKRHNVKRPN